MAGFLVSVAQDVAGRLSPRLLQQLLDDDEGCEASYHFAGGVEVPPVAVLDLHHPGVPSEALFAQQLRDLLTEGKEPACRMGPSTGIPRPNRTAESDALARQVVCEPVEPITNRPDRSVGGDELREAACTQPRQNSGCRERTERGCLGREVRPSSIASIGESVRREGGHEL
jgi:hypothetical protein